MGTTNIALAYTSRQMLHYRIHHTQPQVIKLHSFSIGNFADHSSRNIALEGMINGKNDKDIVIDNIMINGLCEDTKSKAEKRVEWRMLSFQWKICPWVEHYDWLNINSFKIQQNFVYRPLILKSSTANSGTKVAVLLGMNKCGSFPLLSAPRFLFSIWTDL